VVFQGLFELAWISVQTFPEILRPIVLFVWQLHGWMLNFCALRPLPPDPPVVIESAILKRILDYLESHLGVPVAVDDLARLHGLKRRCVHECVAVCSVFGICKKNPSGSVQWYGRQQATVSISRLRDEVIHEGQTQPLQKIFDCSRDPSLPRIATSLVKLHIYLGTKFLDLRKVSRLFCSKTIKYKTMLRKLYTVASILVLVAVHRRTTAASEVQLTYPLRPIIDSSLGLEIMLNTKTELEEEQTCERRRKEFEEVCARGSPGGVA
jgi:hypothetical protein